MKNYIKHIIEPNRLLLMWQGPDRLHRIVGELVRKKSEHVIRLNYLFETKDFQEAEKAEFKGYPAFPLGNQSYSNVLDVFMRRLPPSTRGDYGTFLDSFRIQSNTKLSDFALLGYSGARLPDDKFSIVHPFENATGKFELLTLVHGTRHYQDKNEAIHKLLKVGDLVTFRREVDNSVDNNAIVVFHKTKKVGYLNRGLLTSANNWLDDDSILRSTIERINGTPDNPKIYVFLEVDNK